MRDTLDKCVKLCAKWRHQDAETFKRDAIREACRSLMQHSKDPKERALLTKLLEEAIEEAKARL